MGRYQIVDPYKTYPENGYYNTGSYSMYPTRSLYSKDTYYHMYIQHAQNKYDIVDMYKTQDNGYSARNSDPSPPNWAERLYDSAWLMDYMIVHGLMDYMIVHG